MKILIKIILTVGAFMAFSNSTILADETSLEDLEMPNPRNPEGSLIVGGQPTKADLEKLAKDGYKVVVNLRVPGEFDGFDEPEVVRELGMTYINIPVNGRGELNAENAKLLHEALESVEGPAFVHCGSGFRAGVLLGLEKFQFQGFDQQQAIEFALAANTERLRDTITEALERLENNE